MRIRTATVLVLAAAVSLAAAGVSFASHTPDSQGALCQGALDEITSGEASAKGIYRLGSLHPALLGGVSQRPDEFVLERHRRLDLLQTTYREAGRYCPVLAPFLGMSHGHMLATARQERLDVQ